MNSVLDISVLLLIKLHLRSTLLIARSEGILVYKEMTSKETIFIIGSSVKFNFSTKS